MEIYPEVLLWESVPDNINRPSLVILNLPISDIRILELLWTRTGFKICADGGANRLFDAFDDVEEVRRSSFIPGAIHGDLDSLRPEVREYYASRNSEISKDPDQYSTDFGKVLKKIRERSTGSKSADVLILGSLAGRVDHAVGILHRLQQESKEHPQTQLWLLSESSLSFILKEGKSIVHFESVSSRFTHNVGILPIYGPAKISTEGLEWDVKDWETSMDSQISTSNHLVRSTAVVETDHAVLFTVELSPELPGS